MPLSFKERQAVLSELEQRYRKASRGKKSLLLDEAEELVGLHRNYLCRRLRTHRQDGTVSQIRLHRRGRTPTYTREVREALIKVWAVLDFPAGKRLAPFMAEIVPALERHGEISLTPTVRGPLLRISPATIDRLLASERKRLEIRGRSGTRPGALLKHAIPIRAFADWDSTQPGFLEVDLVSHEGGSPFGEFCQTLDLTDIATGWTETVAVRNKAQRWVFPALTAAFESFPFAVLGIDSDNGSEFINTELFRYCADHKLTFTRSRTEHKNDNCYVEQKNWAVVRKTVGYQRYDHPSQLALLNELYTSLRLYTNFFQPTQKCSRKIRHGAAVRRVYDSARTPCQRILASEHVPDPVKDQVRAIYATLNPAQLQREINRLQRTLLDPPRDEPFAPLPQRRPGPPLKISPYADAPAGVSP